MDENKKENLKHYREELEKARKDFIDSRIDLLDKRSDYFKTISPILFGLLGLLVALNNGDFQNCIQKLLYSLAISIIGLGSVCSLIVLYSLVRISRQKSKIKEDLFQLLRQPLTMNVKKTNRYTSHNRLYDISEITTFVCLGLSMIILTVYVWLF